MLRRPPRSTRTDTLFPYTTLFRSGRITAGDVMRVDMHGMPLDGRSPSAETLLHVLIYRLFRRVNVVLHSHSVPAVVLTRLLGDEPLLRLQGYELLKAFRGIKTHDSALEVPV